MATDLSPLILTLLFFVSFVFFSATSLHARDTNIEIGGASRRNLISFTETSHGSNTTFDCSPSGPCVPCQYSEKNDEKYRCSETGYRIPLKCVEVKDGTKDPKGKISRRSNFEIFSKKVRRLLSDSTKKEKKERAYITYRSCIQSVTEEKLSIIGFEVIVFCSLLSSGFFVYLRKKRSSSTSGFARIQTSSRF